ncbi:MAG: hypothetical protein IT432_16000 [Phycisphaerales bacterium]|nr:hypothetical protein [Phycisphaerales bacterium]
MATLADIVNWTRSVVEAERAFSGAFAAAERETRLRSLLEIELTSRLRHVMGGLEVRMAAQGPDIQGPGVDVQVKFLNYWHTQLDKPQPAAADQIEKDLKWLTASGTPKPRHFVLFMPCRAAGYAVQRTGAAPTPGQRRFQHCISAKNDVLAQMPLTACIVDALSESVQHSKKNGETSTFYQHRALQQINSAAGSPIRFESVGQPDTDLFWSLVCAPP